MLLITLGLGPILHPGVGVRTAEGVRGVFPKRRMVGKWRNNEQTFSTKGIQLNSILGYEAFSH